MRRSDDVLRGNATSYEERREGRKREGGRVKEAVD